ncbi:MAG: hypothetical protein M0P61_06385 [Ignavibacteriaceae bacterium]|jgi:hypothetical protein|nr:hypothetical protein [Ignavibacteriaceae bacterium]
MKNLLKLNLFFLLVLSTAIYGQSNAEEKLNLMQNSLLLGLEIKGIESAVEIISKNEYKSVKEKALFTIAEYFFAEGILGGIDETTHLYKNNYPYINKAYTFYLRLESEYPKGEFNDIVKQRIAYLEFNYQYDLAFRNLGSYLENERIIVEKKLNFTNLFIERENEDPFLFFTKGDKPNTYELINKYFDDIIVNNPSLAIYGYYYKLLTFLSRNKKVQPIKAKFEDESFNPYITMDKYKERTDETIVLVTNLLDTLNGKFPRHPLTIRSYLVAVSYLIKAGIWDYDSKEVKKWLEIALQNDNDKLGIKHLVTKEYILKTKFEE